MQFWIGWWFGFGHFMTSLYWFSNPLIQFSDQFGWMIPFSVTLIPAVLGIYTGIVCYVSSFFKANKIIFALTFTCMWTIIEIARTNFVIPFSWNLLGFSIVSSDELMQIASLIGIYGCTLILLFISSSFFTRNILVIGLSLTLLTSSYGYGYIRLQNKDNEFHKNFQIRLVQPNIQEHPMGNRPKQDEALVKLVELSFLDRSPEVKLILWPEAAFPYGFIEGITNIGHLAKISPKDGGVLIFGSDRVEKVDDNKYDYYNSIITVSENGSILSKYDKEILVPFGEYVPFRKFIPFVQKVTHGLQDMSAGKNQQKVMSIGDFPKFIPLICYEAIFPNIIVDENAEWLFNVTNDAWFGDTIGPYQHYAMVKLRAVEYGMPIVRAANSGISAIVSPYGEEMQITRLNTKGVIDAYLPKKISISTHLIKYTFTYVPYFILLIIIIFTFTGSFYSKSK
jgi:apolipoprotein N-acyltransferase